FTQVGTDTSYVLLAGALLVVGLGLGSTIMPSMAVAFQAVSRDETPRATSALNTIQRIAGAIGTALLAIILQRTIEANAPGLNGGVTGLGSLPPQQRARLTRTIAAAFGTTFWVAVVLAAAALVPALLLPRRDRREERTVAVDQPAA